MTDEQRIGDAGAQNVFEPEPARSDGPDDRTAARDEAGAGKPASADEHNEEAATHGSP